MYNAAWLQLDNGHGPMTAGMHLKKTPPINEANRYHLVWFTSGTSCQLFPVRR